MGPADTIDNLCRPDVVLHDGSFVTASDSSDPELFWALRRRWEIRRGDLVRYRLHPVDLVGGGSSCIRSSGCDHAAVLP